ncbi:MAG: hypothetical protein ACT4OP_00795 [Actinomycetota bacterium]
MSVFAGQLYREDEPPVRASVQVEDGRLRIWTDRRRLVSWDLASTHCERISVFRFLLSDGTQNYEFQPEDPGGLTEELGTVIDLRVSKSRFGLAERLRQASQTG